MKHVEFNIYANPVTWRKKPTVNQYDRGWDHGYHKRVPVAKLNDEYMAGWHRGRSLRREDDDATTSHNQNYMQGWHDAWDGKPYQRQSHHESAYKLGWQDGAFDKATK